MKNYKTPLAKLVLFCDDEICEFNVTSGGTEENWTKRQDNPDNGSIWNTWTSEDDK